MPSTFEQVSFDDWLATQTGRVTGWMTWRASLAARGCSADHARPAFDAWLLQARARDWDLVDAWTAAAAWAV